MANLNWEPTESYGNFVGQKVLKATLYVNSSFTDVILYPKRHRTQDAFWMLHVRARLGQFLLEPRADVEIGVVPESEAKDKAADIAIDMMAGAITAAGATINAIVTA